MADPIIRIAVIGPESSGKSDLCAFLADYYDTVWVKEYARTYLPLLKAKYTAADIYRIYSMQYDQELELTKNANDIIFIDTEFIIGKVWSESAFGKCDPYFDNMIHQAPYDLYLLTYPDLPWVFDPLRENPGKGIYYFDWYKRILDENNLPYGIVSGTGHHRQQSAIAIISSYRAKISKDIQ